MHGTYLWISHFLLLGSFIKFSLSDWATPLLSDCLSNPPPVFLSFRFLSASQIHLHTHTHTYTIALHHSGWLIFINIEIVEQLGFQLKAPFILPCLHLRIIAPLFSASVAESVQQGVLIALESLSLFYQEMTQPFKKNNKKIRKKKTTSILGITRVHATLICCFCGCRLCLPH